jgi:hypothetical protein
MEGMKAKLAEWRTEIKNDDSFRAFYYFVFDYLREANKVILRTSSSVLSSFALRLAISLTLLFVA